MPLLFPPGHPSQRILVCDDERHITRLFQTNLERQGHLVTCLHDGQTAIDLLRTLPEPPFDRILLDLMMPLRDGYEVLTWIRENPALQNTWVALMTPSPKDRELLETLPHRADAYFSKPFNPTEII